MAVATRKLTDISVRALRSVGYHSDGDGLYFRVKPSQAKSWVFRYRFNGFRRDKGLGSYLDVTLAEARTARDDARRLVVKGVDPLGVVAKPKANPEPKTIIHEETEAALGPSDGHATIMVRQRSTFAGRSTC